MASDRMGRIPVYCRYNKDLISRHEGCQSTIMEQYTERGVYYEREKTDFNIFNGGRCSLYRNCRRYFCDDCMEVFTGVRKTDASVWQYGGTVYGFRKSFRESKVKRTERLLFYLGVVFTGFFTLSVMTGLFGQDTLFFPINAFYMLMANLAMLVPVLIRLMVCKKGFEFSMAVFWEKMQV